MIDVAESDVSDCAAIHKNGQKIPTKMICIIRLKSMLNGRDSIRYPACPAGCLLLWNFASHKSGWQGLSGLKGPSPD